MEELAFQIILHAGDARSQAMEALRMAREQKFEEAQELIQGAKEKLIEAHHIQTGLLQAEAGGTKQEVCLLMVHAQDHLMTAMLAKDLIEEMVLMLKGQAAKG